jgi:DNA-binding NtrC family response regulator
MDRELIKMTSHILILADQKARRLSHKQSLQSIRPNSEFILVKSFSQALDVLTKQLISLIVLDSQVDDSPNHRTRSEAIQELKQKSNNTSIVLVGTKINHAINSLKDGADGFLPVHWLNNV